MRAGYLKGAQSGLLNRNVRACQGAERCGVCAQDAQEAKGWRGGRDRAALILLEGANAAAEQLPSFDLRETKAFAYPADVRRRQRFDFGSGRLKRVSWLFHKYTSMVYLWIN